MSTKFGRASDFDNVQCTNDPRDIPMMLDKLDEGYDLVHGWRKNRKDHLVSRKIPSRIANWLISKVTEFPIHDLGCTLKAMRTEIASQIELYGEMHRFIPILAHQLGAKSIEVVTNHRARQFGEKRSAKVQDVVRAELRVNGIRFYRLIWVDDTGEHGRSIMFSWFRKDRAQPGDNITVFRGPDHTWWEGDVGPRAEPRSRIPKVRGRPRG